MTYQTSLLQIIENNPSASVRLKNCLKSSKKEIHSSVEDFISDPDSYRVYHKIPNFGRKCWDELQSIIRDFKPCSESGANCRTSQEFNIPLEDFILNNPNASVRLRNVFKEFSKHLPHKSLFDYQNDSNRVSKYLSLPRVGKGTAVELERLVKTAASEYKPTDWSSAQLESSFISACTQNNYRGYLRTSEISLVLASMNRIDGLAIAKISEALSKFSVCTFDDLTRYPQPADLLNSLDSELAKLLLDSMNLLIEKGGLHPVFLGYMSYIDECDLDSISLKSLLIQLLTKGGLNHRESKIIRNRFGIDAPKLTLEQLGAELNITRERVRQIEKKAIAKLASAIREFEMGIATRIFSDEIAESVFGKSDFVSSKRVSVEKNKYPGWLQLYFKIKGELLSQQFSKHFIHAEDFDGWFRNQEVVPLFKGEYKKAAMSTSQGIEECFFKLPEPVYLDQLAREVCIPGCVVLDYILATPKKYRIRKIHNDFVIERRKLTFRQMILNVMLRKKEQMTLYEIAENLEKLYGEKANVHRIGAALSHMKEALIVERGTYNLYTNLGLDSERLISIRNAVREYLLERQVFVSSKVIAKKLKIKNSTKLAMHGIPAYTLHGILQDDERFQVCRGLMIGLYEANFKGEHQDLITQILKLFQEKGTPMSIQDIIDELSDVRDLLVPALSNMLEDSKVFEKDTWNRFIPVSDSLEEILGNKDWHEEALLDEWVLDEVT